MSKQTYREMIGDIIDATVFAILGGIAFITAVAICIAWGVSIVYMIYLLGWYL